MMITVHLLHNHTLHQSKSCTALLVNNTTTIPLLNTRSRENQSVSDMVKIIRSTLNVPTKYFGQTVVQDCKPIIYYPTYKFLATWHPYYVIVLLDISKLILEVGIQSNYCKCFNQCNTKVFWTKMKRHFKTRRAPTEVFIGNGKIVFLPHQKLLSKSIFQLSMFNAKHRNRESLNFRSICQLAR